jgi:hypothetical protein
MANKDVKELRVDVYAEPLCDSNSLRWLKGDSAILFFYTKLYTKIR